MLLDEVEKILCQAVCEWAGITTDSTDIAQRTEEISAMIDGAGAIGPRNWKGTRLRWRTEQWARQLIRKVHTGEYLPPASSALNIIAHHHDHEEQLLDIDTAAVELLNILRPTVATGRYVLFAALALHEFPHCRQVAQDPLYRHFFIQEVRRLYPFFPFVGGLVKKEFDWRGYHFTRGQRVLLDLYGTNRDPRFWDQPEVFNPERFRHWEDNAFTFIPQGGGDFNINHRCAGEWLTIALLQRAVLLLTHQMDYEVKPGDLRIDLTRMPAQPRTPLILRNIKRRR